MNAAKPEPLCNDTSPPAKPAHNTGLSPLPAQPGMKVRPMIPVLITILVCYIAIHAFVGRSILQSLHDTTWARSIALAVFVLLGSGWIVSSLLIRSGVDGWLVGVLHQAGSYWLAFFLYFVLTLVILWAVRLASDQTDRLQTIAGFLTAGHRLLIAGGLALLVTLGGAINARGLVVREYTLPIATIQAIGGPEAVPPEGEAVRLAFLSDLHIGTSTSLDRLHTIVETVNALKPDLILIGGDIIDMSPEEDKGFAAGTILRGFRARHGVFACPGNHEYILDPKISFSWISRAGIRLLDDAAVSAGPIRIVGRRDWAGARHGLRRRSLRAILGETSNTNPQPLIVLDHQPKALDEAAQSSARLVLSGHTHHGQLWPINWITSAIFENSHGMIQKEGTTCITTSGVSVWGPQVRTSSRPEIVLIRLSRE